MALCARYVKADRSNPDAPLPPLPMPAPLGLCEADRLIVLDGGSKDDMLDVVRKPDGSIGWLRMWGRLFAKVSVQSDLRGEIAPP